MPIRPLIGMSIRPLIGMPIKPTKACYIPRYSRPLVVASIMDIPMSVGNVLNVVVG